MTVFEEAIVFAAERHGGMKRKLDSAPYILHPIEAALIVSTMTQDEEVLAAAVLHDVVEDTDTELSEIEERFGPRVAALVASETEDKRPDMPKSQSWMIRKLESLHELQASSDPAVKYLWLGDKLANLRGLFSAYKKLGPDVWNCFNQKDPAMHARYYRAIDRLLSDLGGFATWKEYHDLVKEIFDGVPEE